MNTNNTASLGCKSNEEASIELLNWMRYLSEAVLGEPLSPGHDIRFWESLHGRDGILDESDNKRLQSLSEQADGWWVVLPEQPERFLSLRSWNYFMDVAL